MAENTKTDELYDELDQKVIDALCVDPRVQWSYAQRKAVRQLVNSEVRRVLDLVDDRLIHSHDKDNWAVGVNFQESNILDRTKELRNKYPLKKEES